MSTTCVADRREEEHIGVDNIDPALFERRGSDLYLFLFGQYPNSMVVTDQVSHVARKRAGWWVSKPLNVDQISKRIK